MAKKIKELSINERVKRYQEAEKKLLDKYSIVTQYVLSFPKRQNKKPPIAARIGLFLLRKSGGVFLTQFIDKTQSYGKGNK